MNRPAQDRIHAVEIPIAGLSLLVPSASIAEVTTVSPLTRVPFGSNWLLGAVAWRQQALPVVSFEALFGLSASAVGSSSNIIVFYPLTGRREWEFFGVLSVAEPRPHAVNAATVAVAEADELPSSSFIASGLKLAGRIMAIPDTEALKRVFYPQ